MFTIKRFRLFALMALLAPFAIYGSQEAQPAAKVAVDAQALAEFNASQFSLLSVGDSKLSDILCSDAVDAIAGWPALAVVAGYNLHGKTLLDWAKRFNAQRIIAHLERADLKPLEQSEDDAAAADLDSADEQSDDEDAVDPRLISLIAVTKAQLAQKHSGKDAKD